MPILTDKQIQYGFNYYHKDEPQPRGIVEVSQYGGEAALKINCTQLGDSFTPQLRFFRFLTARLRSKDYTPVLSLADIEHLDLSTCKEVMALYYEMRKLPKLKYGLIAERYDLYEK